MSGDALKFDGFVVEANRGVFTIAVDMGGGPKRNVHAKLSGRLIKNRIRCILGDFVEIEVSPYDVTKGRITHRGRREARQ